MTDQEYYWEKAEFQDPVSHRQHVENYKKGIRSSVGFDDEYMKEAIDELMCEIPFSSYYRDISIKVCLLDEKYREIIRLHGMLAGNDIPHTICRRADGWQILYPAVGHPDDCVMDAIELMGSYGREDDLLEIMGLLTPEEEEQDSVLGYLTAENVFERIKKHWEENHG